MSLVMKLKIVGVRKRKKWWWKIDKLRARSKCSLYEINVDKLFVKSSQELASLKIILRCTL